MKNVDFLIATGEAEGFTDTVYLCYKILYRDASNIASTTKFIYVGQVDGTDEAPAVVVLFYIPAAYDGSLDRLEVYRGVLPGAPVAANGATPVDGTTYHVIGGTAFYNGGTYPNGSEFTGVTGGGDVTAGGGVTILALPNDFFLIGEVEGEDEGVFIDKNQPTGAALPCTDAIEVTFESAIRKSEPYAPWWLKADQVVEFRAGDGDQITGIASQYGNLVVFKEHSMHRVAVQDPRSDVMFSRTDEVSPDVGCIAPQTLITVENNIFFLSRQGFMTYDNNVIKNVDGKFHNELMYRLRTLNKDIIREASCGWNPEHGELYLNIPSRGRSTYYDKEKDLVGHIYVLSLHKGYVSKYAYERYSSYSRLMRSHARLYATNSLGQLRSAEVRRPAAYTGGQAPAGPGTFPDPDIDIIVTNGTIRYNNIDYKEGDTFTTIDGIDAASTTDGGKWGYSVKIRAAIFLDSPTEASYDSVYDENGNLLESDITNEWRSKFFTGGIETVTKRVRKALVNMWSEQPRKMSIISAHRDNDDDRIDNGTPYVTTNTFGNNASVPTNVLSLIPNTVAAEVPDPTIHWDDRFGRPLRLAIDLESSGRTQINEVAFYYRPVNTHLA